MMDYLYKIDNSRTGSENFLEHRPFFDPKTVRIRRSKNHWSITIPIEVRRALGWGKNYMPAGLFWLDAGLKNGALVVSIHDANVQHELDTMKSQRGNFRYL